MDVGTASGEGVREGGRPRNSVSVGVAVGVAAAVAAAVGDGVAVLPVFPNEGVLDVGVGVEVKDPGLDWTGLAVPVLVGVGVLKGVFR